MRIIAAAKKIGKTIQHVRRKIERLADFAGGASSAISDDVGRHGSAEFAVALIDVLDGALALISAGKIKVYVGPFAALFRQKALEQQVHANRIDRGDAEGITDRAVRR